MSKKIVFAIFLCILCLFSACRTTENTGDETPVFLPGDDIPADTEEPAEPIESTEPTDETTDVPQAEEPTPEITEEPTTEPATDPPVPPVIIPPTIIIFNEKTGEIERIEEPEDLDVPERFAELYQTIVQYGDGVSVFYKDLTDGEAFYYNPDKNYFIASLIKAPYAVYIYKSILKMTETETESESETEDEEKGYDPEKTYEYIESDYREGTGKIKDMEFGTEFTIEELISYAIRWSDNVAMDKLRRIFPVSGFREYAAEIGLPHLGDIRSSAVNGVICAMCVAAYIEGIYDFIEEGNIYSEVLKEHMLNTINRMIYARYPFVRKYGWAEDSFHDMGIVYNEDRPYLIAVLSNNGEGDFPMFRDISLAIQRYNDEKEQGTMVIAPTP